jgi:hypothetical protein
MAHKHVYYDIWSLEGDPEFVNTRTHYREKPAGKGVIVGTGVTLSGGRAGKPKLKLHTKKGYRGDRLAQVGDDDVLLIEGHGSVGADRIFSHEEEGEGREVSARALAKIILKDGLPRTHKYVRLIMCHSANTQKPVRGKLPNYHEDHVREPRLESFQCFAQLLAICLGYYKYHQIAVCGYKGIIKSGRAGVGKDFKHPEYKQWYNAQGKPISKSDVKGADDEAEPSQVV